MPAPAAPADPVRAIFEKLADGYKFSSKIVDKFMSLKLESLADFRFFVESELEIEKAFIDGIPDLDQPRLQLARVRHAWSACVAETKAGEARKMKEAEKADDEEFVLPPARMDEMKQAFFKRYHLCLTPGEWPSDRLVSKVWKQLDKRSLEVQDLWLVKSLTYQKTTPAKKRKVAELRAFGPRMTPMIMIVKVVRTWAPTSSVWRSTSWPWQLSVRLTGRVRLEPQRLWGWTARTMSCCHGTSCRSTRWGLRRRRASLLWPPGCRPSSSWILRRGPSGPTGLPRMHLWALARLSRRWCWSVRLCGSLAVSQLFRRVHRRPRLLQRSRAQVHLQGVSPPRLFPSCVMAPPCVWTSRRASVRPRIARRASIVVDACSKVDVSAAVGATTARTVRWGAVLEKGAGRRLLPRHHLTMLMMICPNLSSRSCISWSRCPIMLVTMEFLSCWTCFLEKMHPLLRPFCGVAGAFWHQSTLRSMRTLMLRRNLFRRLCFIGCPKSVWWLQRSPVPPKQELERKGLDPYPWGQIISLEACRTFVLLIPGEWRMITWCLTLGCLPRPGWHLRGLAASGKTHITACTGWIPLSVGFPVQVHGTIWITMHVSFRELGVSSKRFDTTWTSWICCQKLRVGMCMPKMNGPGKIEFPNLRRGGVHTFAGLHSSGGRNSLGSPTRFQDRGNPQDTTHSSIRRCSSVAAVWAEDASQRADGGYGAPPGIEEWWDTPAWGASPAGGKQRLCWPFNPSGGIRFPPVAGGTLAQPLPARQGWDSLWGSGQVREVVCGNEAWRHRAEGQNVGLWLPYVKALSWRRAGSCSLALILNYKFRGPYQLFSWRIRSETCVISNQWLQVGVISSCCVQPRNCGVILQDTVPFCQLGWIQVSHDRRPAEW